MFGQIKHSINISKGNKIFGDVIQAAWKDFNNPDIFEKGADTIALITGPLSSTDTNDVRTILEWARHSENAQELLNKIELANFSGKKKREKLIAFKLHLKNANRGNDVSDDELFQFLRHFYLFGYDLDIKAGVSLSLLNSLIGLYSQNNVRNLWLQIIDEVQSANKNAGTITLEMISHELRIAFKNKVYETIPPEFSVKSLMTAKTVWSQHRYSSELAIAMLLGSWNENFASDIAIVNRFVKEDYSIWISKIRDILQQPESPISFKNGIWNASKRKALWYELGTRLFDNDLAIFKQCTVEVLTERDPQFDLPPEERYAASIRGKVLKYSSNMRRGLSESLALLGNNPDALPNCSLYMTEKIIYSSVQEIFENANWMLWGSLDNLLPLFAEAVPVQFLQIVDHSLQQSPCLFNELFLQEGDGITGRNYLSGFLWAMEALAWEEQFIVRVTAILGELASYDPGGKWANRPSNSLRTIFLPWLPQTMASVEKRRVALQTLQIEFPDVAWSLLIGLMPNQHQSSSGSYKPQWRNILTENWKKGVTNEEYREQVTIYAELAVVMAKDDISRLKKVISLLGNLPQQAFNDILEYLSSEAILSKEEKERLGLWTELVEVASKHKQFVDADWALSPVNVVMIQNVAIKLAPSNPMNLHRRLFRDRDFDLYEEVGNTQEERARLEERRQRAMKDILDHAEFSEVIEFAESVESSLKAGYSLGFVAELEIDSLILPSLLETERKSLVQLVSGYVWGRYCSRDWAWVDNITANTTEWAPTQKGLFLTYLPFSAKTWSLADTLLGDSEIEYWSRVNVNPYQIDGDMEFAVDKLIEYGRSHAAIDCLYKALYENQSLNKKRTIDALLSAVDSHETSYAMDGYHIVEIIKALQNDPNTPPEDIFQVEWAYLPLLDRYNDASPKLLGNRLASDSSFFCQVIRLVYRSTKEKKQDKELSAKEKAIATNAYQLLREWRTPPGIKPDGNFSVDEFTQWLESTKVACIESGHLEVALIHLGGVLVYCPVDPSGLWIDRKVAAILNEKESEKMRNGFCTKIINNRGAYWVDPTGKPERELAGNYRRNAEDIENAGYHRFATTLRGLADSYDRDADGIVIEHNQED